MTLSLLFWILMLLWLVLGGITIAKGEHKLSAISVQPVLLYLLFLVLGWAVFGAPIK